MPLSRARYLGSRVDASAIAGHRRLPSKSATSFARLLRAARRGRAEKEKSDAMARDEKQ